MGRWSGPRRHLAPHGQHRVFMGMVVWGISGQIQVELGWMPSLWLG